MNQGKQTPSPRGVSNQKEKKKNELEGTIIMQKVKNSSGVEFFESWKVGRILGTGGFATCYEFINTATQNVQACKLVKKSTLVKPKAKLKMMSELKIHQKMKHKYICQYKSFFEDESNIYLMLEYCSNDSLSNLLERRNNLTELEVQYYAMQLIQVLSYMRGEKIIHRDLKLHNILLSDIMEIKVCDFGLACQLVSENERKFSFCGTPNYIAPEILKPKSEEGYGFEVDIWALGITIFTLLIGKPPFEGKDVKTTQDLILSGLLDFPDDSPKISDEAKDLIQKLLMKNPSKRPTTEQILMHQFFIMNRIPTKLPTSLLRCPPTVKFIQQYIPNQKSLKIVAVPNFLTKPENKGKVGRSQTNIGLDLDNEVTQENIQKKIEQDSDKKETPTNFLAPVLKQAPQRTQTNIKSTIEDKSPKSNKVQLAPINKNFERSSSSIGRNGQPKQIKTFDKKHFQRMQTKKVEEEKESDDSSSRSKLREKTPSAIVFNSHTPTNKTSKLPFISSTPELQMQSLTVNMNRRPSKMIVPETLNLNRRQSKLVPSTSLQNLQALKVLPGTAPLENNTLLAPSRTADQQSVSQGRRPSKLFLIAPQGALQAGRRQSIMIKPQLAQLAQLAVVAETPSPSIQPSPSHRRKRNLQTTKQTEKKPPAIFVQKWVDYSQKYGFAFLMSDGNLCVNFNDKTKLLSENGSSQFVYISRDSNKKEIQDKYSFDQQLEENLQKKVKLYRHFQKYLQTNTSTKQSKLQSINPAPESVVVKKWIKKSHGIIFCLSSHIVQVYFKDQTELFIDVKGKLVTFISKQEETVTVTNSEVATCEDAELRKRLQYTKEVLAKDKVQQQGEQIKPDDHSSPAITSSRPKEQNRTKHSLKGSIEKSPIQKQSDEHLLTIN